MKFYGIVIVVLLILYVTICNGLPYVLVRANSFRFINFCCSTVSADEMRMADKLGSEVQVLSLENIL